MAKSDLTIIIEAQDKASKVVESTASKTEKALNNMASSFKDFEGSIKDAVKDIKDFKDDLDGVDDKAKKAGDGIEKFGQQSSHGFNISRKALVGLGAAFGAYLGAKVLGGLKQVGEGVIEVTKELIDSSNELEFAFAGLESAARGYQVSAEAAKTATEELASDGTIKLNQAARVMQNLISVFGDVDLSTQVALSLKDIGAFKNIVGDLGQAMVDASKGIKTNSIELTENIGLMTRLGIALNQAGFQMADLTSGTQQVAAKQALANIIIKEGALSAGDAALAAQTYTGRLAAVNTELTLFKGSLGGAITKNKDVLAVMREMREMLKEVRDDFGFLKDDIGDFAGDLSRAFLNMSISIAGTMPTLIRWKEQVSNIFDYFGIAGDFITEKILKIERAMTPDSGRYAKRYEDYKRWLDLVIKTKEDAVSEGIADAFLGTAQADATAKNWEKLVERLEQRLKEFNKKQDSAVDDKPIQKKIIVKADTTEAENQVALFKSYVEGTPPFILSADVTNSGVEEFLGKMDQALEMSSQLDQELAGVGLSSLDASIELRPDFSSFGSDLAELQPQVVTVPVIFEVESAELPELKAHLQVDDGNIDQEIKNIDQQIDDLGPLTTSIAFDEDGLAQTIDDINQRVKEFELDEPVIPEESFADITKYHVDYLETFDELQDSLSGTIEQLPDDLSVAIGASLATLILEANNAGEAMKRIFKSLAHTILTELLTALTKAIAKMIALKIAAAAVGALGGPGGSAAAAAVAHGGGTVSPAGAILSPLRFHSGGSVRQVRRGGSYMVSPISPLVNRAIKTYHQGGDVSIVRSSATSNITNQETALSPSYVSRAIRNYHQGGSVLNQGGDISMSRSSVIDNAMNQETVVAPLYISRAIKTYHQGGDVSIDQSKGYISSSGPHQSISSVIIEQVRTFHQGGDVASTSSNQAVSVINQSNVDSPSYRSMSLIENGFIPVPLETPTKKRLIVYNALSKKTKNAPSYISRTVKTYHQGGNVGSVSDFSYHSEDPQGDLIVNNNSWRESMHLGDKRYITFPSILDIAQSSVDSRQFSIKNLSGENYSYPDRREPDKAKDISVSLFTTKDKKNKVSGARPFNIRNIDRIDSRDSTTTDRRFFYHSSVESDRSRETKWYQVGQSGMASQGNLTSPHFLADSEAMEAEPTFLAINPSVRFHLGGSAIRRYHSGGKAASMISPPPMKRDEILLDVPEGTRILSRVEYGRIGKEEGLASLKGEKAPAGQSGDAYFIGPAGQVVPTISSDNGGMLAPPIKDSSSNSLARIIVQTGERAILPNELQKIGGEPAIQEKMLETKTFHSGGYVDRIPIFHDGDIVSNYSSVVREVEKSAQVSSEKTIIIKDQQPADSYRGRKDSKQPPNISVNVQGDFWGDPFFEEKLKDKMYPILKRWGVVDVNR